MLWLALLILVVGTAPRPTLSTAGGYSCWSSGGDAATCLILATLFKGEEDALAEPGYSLLLDCGTSGNDAVAEPSLAELAGNTTGGQQSLLSRRLDWAQSVLLDGCQTALGAGVTSSYGLELLPNCARLARITVKRFQADVVAPLVCQSTSSLASSTALPAAGSDSDSVDKSAGDVGGGDLKAEVLHFRNNEFANVAASSMRGLRRLRALHFTANSLRRIEPAAFEHLRQADLIVLQDEPLLAIKAADADLFARCGVAELRLIALKLLAAELFTALPETLRAVYVERTRVEGDMVRLTNALQLRNVTIAGCGLKAFMLRDPHATVDSVNLSGNALKEFELIAGKGEIGAVNVSLSLESLDLSENQLSVLPTQWLRAAPKLRQLLLRGNRLKTLSLQQLLAATPAAALIDLRDNSLVALRDTAASHFDVDRIATRLRIDRNPWRCVWLLDFAHAHPERFRLFQYEKFISRINVNGLQCIADDVDVRDTNEHAVEADQRHLERNEATASSAPPLRNVSTYTLVYGSPWDFKRNQRAEALVIVFMLPLGIAILFLLLYLWINCQRMFHLSYYRAMGGGCRSTAPSSGAASRFDVVRELPPLVAAAGDFANNNDGYEVPLTLNGVTSSMCNCNHSTPSTAAAASADKGGRTHHITYVPLPAEQPYKIYEEIIDAEDGNDDNIVRGGIHAPPHPFYDHLSFVDPSALQ